MSKGRTNYINKTYFPKLSHQILKIRKQTIFYSLKTFENQSFLTKMNMSEYASSDQSPAINYYSHNYTNYYAQDSYSNYDNSLSSYPSTPGSNASESNYTSPLTTYYSPPEFASPIPKYNDYSANYSQYQDNSPPITSLTANIDPTHTITPTVQVKKGKRPRVVKLDLTRTSIGFGVPQKSSKLNDQVSDIDCQLKCSMCSKSFKSSAKLFMHQHKYHNNGSSLQCPICLKNFNSQANALVHVRAHTQEKSYKCHICSIGFCDSSTLKKHLRTHTGEKPYECHLCPKRFTQSGNLKRHLTVHEKYDVIQAKPIVNDIQATNTENYYTIDKCENESQHQVQNTQTTNLNWYPEQSQLASNSYNTGSYPTYNNIESGFYNNHYYYNNCY